MPRYSGAMSHAAARALLALPLAGALAACQGGAAPEGAASADDASAPEGAAPEEFGDVAWGRDLDGALARARRSESPVLLLFQEVPG